VGASTCDDAAVYKINEQQAIVLTTDFFMPIGTLIRKCIILVTQGNNAAGFGTVLQHQGLSSDSCKQWSSCMYKARVYTHALSGDEIQTVQQTVWLMHLYTVVVDFQLGSS
jgi:hypothetical protein